MNTDEHRSGADFGHLECEIANPIIGGVPETGVYSQSSASVFIGVHLWLPSIFGLGLRGQINAFYLQCRLTRCGGGFVRVGTWGGGLAPLAAGACSSPIDVTVAHGA